jgi:predicted ester cyclase
MATNDVVAKHIEAFNSKNAEAETYAADAELIAPGASIKGRENVLGFLSVFHMAFPDGRLEVKQSLVDGSYAVNEGSFVGTHTGVLQSPAGEIPATGKAVNLRWAAVYEIRGSELAYEHLFFDQMELLGQLGLLPS